MQKVAYQLPTQTYSPGGRTIITLKELPKVIGGKHCHLDKLQFDVAFTPTFDSGAVDPPGTNKIFSLEFNDGNGVTRFNGDLNTLRAKERIHTGRIRNPDPDTGTTATARYWSRTLHMGPPQMVGASSDFCIPTGALVNAQIVLNHSSLAGVSADLDSATGSLRVIAWLTLLDEIRVPPAYRFVQENATAKSHHLTGRARYESIFVIDSADYGVIAAGDFGAFRLDMGRGEIVQTVDAEGLRNGYNDDFASGEAGIVGEPEAASDDNHKVVNRASPTAVAAAAADLQPVAWTPPGGKLTKLPEAENVAKLSWNGSQTTAGVLYGQFLAQDQNVVANIIAKATREAGVSMKGSGPKTHSKAPFKGGPHDLAYMPWKVKV